MTCDDWTAQGNEASAASTVNLPKAARVAAPTTVDLPVAAGRLEGTAALGAARRAWDKRRKRSHRQLARQMEREI